MCGYVHECLQGSGQASKSKPQLSFGCLAAVMGSEDLTIPFHSPPGPVLLIGYGDSVGCHSTLMLSIKQITDVFLKVFI